MKEATEFFTIYCDFVTKVTSDPSLKIDKLKEKDKFNINDLGIDSQLIEKIFKFASIKHILNLNKNDNSKLFDLLEEISRDLKNYELELRIEELESKFSKDLNEKTFNEIRELKKLQNLN